MRSIEQLTEEILSLPSRARAILVDKLDEVQARLGFKPKANS